MTRRGWTAMLGLAALAALAGCDNDVVVRPVIDTAPGEKVFEDVDTIVLSVAIDGEATPLTSALIRRGETIELPGVPYGENLVIHMSGLLNSSEIAYGRTCRFSLRAGQEPLTPHLYFARTVRWGDSAFPPSAIRIGGAALTSRDGSALYVGGLDHNNDTVLGADRFDPLAGRFEELEGLLPRRGTAAGNLGDGRALVVGGTEPDGRVAEYLDVITFDSSAQRVEHIDTPMFGFIDPPGLATLSDGSVVAIGGRNQHGQPVAQVSLIAGEGGGITVTPLLDAALTTPRYGHTVTRLSDDLGAPVLIAGGLDAAGNPVKASELYRPLVERIAPPSEFAVEMKVPRWNHAAVRLPDGSVLIIGGQDKMGPVGSLELFTRETGFIVQGYLPIGTGLTDFSVTTLPDGRILIAGGKDATGAAVDTVRIVRSDPLGGGINVLPTDPLSAKRAGHEATLLCDGTVLLVGGTTEPTAAERYNPPSSGRR